MAPLTPDNWFGLKFLWEAGAGLIATVLWIGKIHFTTNANKSAVNELRSDMEARWTARDRQRAEDLVNSRREMDTFSGLMAEVRSDIKEILRRTSK